MGEATEALVQRLAQIGHIGRASAVLGWDLQTYMPPGGARARSDQMAVLAGIVHERLVAEETGALLARAEDEAAALDGDSDEARLVRNARRDYDRAVKIPAPLVAELTGHTAYAQDAWAQARSADDYGAFAPLLEKTLALLRQVVDYLGYEDDPYDALLDEYEPGARAAEVAAVFDEARPPLVELVRRIAAAPQHAGLPDGPYPVDRQDALTHALVADLGYDLRRGRQDRAPHPFTTSFSRDDVRITTRFDEHMLAMSLYASLHEAGHALYEQGIPAGWDNTPLGGAASSGFHESQSRLWENLVGRSLPYCRYLAPRLRETFGDALGHVDAEGLYGAVNRVEPSLIRVEADEVTYNLHIMLRFALERDLLAGRLAVADLPEAWNAGMRDYLGAAPPDNAQGVLQDIHWAAGLVGYFPTYALGNLIAAQLWHTVRRALPDLDHQVEAGEFAPLLGWLRQNVHAQGRKWLPGELIVKVTGEPLRPAYFAEYLRAKYEPLYGLG